MSSIAASVVPPVVYKTLTGDYGYTHAQTPNLSGRVGIITGGTNGIGLSLARTLYSHGMELYVIGHQREMAEGSLEYIKTGRLSAAPKDYQEGFDEKEEADTSGAGAIVDGKVEFVQCRLTDLKEVAKTAKELKSRLKRLDNFFGIAGKGTNAFELTDDGYDSHVTINNLAHHVFLSHLLPLMIKTDRENPDADVRILLMSSELHRATFGGPSKLFGGSRFTTKEELKGPLGPDNAYARSKLAAILQVKALAQRHLLATRVLTYATHPGAVATGQQEQLKKAYGDTVGTAMASVVRLGMRRPDQGSMSVLWAGIAPEARDPQWPNGMYFTDPAEKGRETSEADDQELIDNFYHLSEEVIREVVGPESMGDWKS